VTEDEALQCAVSRRPAQMSVLSLLLPDYID
jgi:hypothetical protein